MLNHLLLLATESRYKIALLQRLNISFETQPANIDETPAPREHPKDLATRLARQKAQSLQAACPTHWILGSDQAAEIDGETLTKPGTIERAMDQLRSISGRQVDFHTSICLVGPDRTVREHTETVIVSVRHLTPEEIERYVRHEQPLDCAGSFKVEALGISLFSAVKSQDPTALEGLPLITVAQWLRDIGLHIP